MPAAPRGGEAGGGSWIMAWSLGGAPIMPTPRIAIGGFMLESNGHSPLATREEFAANFIAAGEALREDWRGEHPRAPLTLTGFVEGMDKSGTWEALPLFCAMVGASGPV